MVRFINKCSRLVDIVFTPLTLGFLVLLVVSCLAQVFTRYVLNASLPWTEEVARYCFIWTNMLGAAVLTKRKKHAVIDFMVKNLSGLKKRTHEAALCVITMMSAGVLIYQSILLLPVVAMQISPGTGLPMSYVYLSVPVGSAGIFIHMLSDFFDAVFPPKENTQPQGGVA